MGERLPTISVIVVSYNNEKIIPECIEAILLQDYPKELLEYLLIDGGSTDATRTIAASYGFRVIESPVPRNAEAQRAVGLEHARQEIVAYIDTDNILPTRQWLQQMVEPFINHKEVICSQTLHYTHRKNDTLLNRYCALFGGSDPVVYYVGRPDRLDWSRHRWVLGDQIQDMGNYYLVQFSERNLPTVGCNGVLVRREPLVRYALSAPDVFLHIDIFVDLLRNGFRTFAIVKNDVIHATAYTLRNLIKKRVAFLRYYFGQKAPRRYKIYDHKRARDNIRMALFVLYTVTFVKPVIDSIRGYVHLRDPAWFMHPFVCWTYLYAYGKATVKHVFRTWSYHHGAAI